MKSTKKSFCNEQRYALQSYVQKNNIFKKRNIFRDNECLLFKESLCTYIYYTYK